MTNVKRKNKIILSLSLLFALCLTLIFSVLPAGAASDVIIPAKILFPFENRGVTYNDVINRAENGNEVTTSSEGVVINSRMMQRSDTYPYVYNYSYEYFKQLRATDFSLDVLFDSTWQENDELIFALETTPAVGQSVLIKWTLKKQTGLIIVNIAQYTGGSSIPDNGARIFSFPNETTTIKIGIVHYQDTSYRAYAIYPGATIDTGNSCLASVDTSTLVDFSVAHKVYTPLTDSAKSFKCTLQSLCGVDLTGGNEAGIIDKSAPAVTVSPINDSFLTFPDTNSINFKVGQTGGVDNTLKFNLSVFDIFADEDEMVMFVEDTFGGKTYTIALTTFSSQFVYDPLSEFINNLPIGNHNLKIGVQKRNGLTGFEQFAVQVQTPFGDTNVKPRITIVNPPATVEYYTPTSTTIPAYSAVDCLGESVPVTVQVTDPNYNTFGLDANKRFNPELLGNYIIAYSATDDYGNKEIVTRTTNSVKTTSPTHSAAGSPTNKIYYKENTYNPTDYALGKCLLNAEDAVVLFNDVDGGRNLTITILVEYDSTGAGNWLTVTSTHSFVPDKNAPYRITYTATDLAGHSSSRTFNLQVENRIVAPELVMDGFSFPQTFVYRPTYTTANHMIVLPEHVRSCIRDFNSSLCTITLDIKKYNASNALVSIESGEYSSSTGQFTPKDKDGRYLFTFIVRNTAGKETSVSYTVTVYSYRPSFKVPLTEFEGSISTSISILKTTKMPEMKSSYVLDEYASTIAFTVSVSDPEGSNVTSLYDPVTRNFSPVKEGRHTFTYTATNIVGNSVSISFSVDVIAYSPEFININNFGMPEKARFYLEEYYTAATATEIPKMTSTFVNDPYDKSKITFTVTVYKYNELGQPVQAGASEYLVSGAGMEFDLFYPAQTGLYTFIYTAKNEAGKTTSVSLSIPVIAYAPELKEIEAFAAAMPVTYLYYTNYANAPQSVLKAFPEFDKYRYVVDHKDLISMRVELVIKRPNGDIVTQGQKTDTSAEYNFDTRLFRPAVTGQYTFIYTVLSGSGESTTLSYGVLVYAHTPSISTAFVLPSAGKYRQEIEIPLLTSEYITDAYGSIATPVMPEVKNRFDQNPQGVPANNEYSLNGSTGRFLPNNKGLYTFTYTIENAGGQKATVVFNIFISMDTPSFIFKIGGVAIQDFWSNYKIMQYGDPFTVPQAEARDQMGTLITGSGFTATFKAPDNDDIVALPFEEHVMNLSALGTYVFTYTAIDSTGNEISAVFTVKCEDSIYPVISVYDEIKTDYFTFAEYDSENAAHNLTIRRFGLGMGWYANDPSVAGGTDAKGSGIVVEKSVLLILCPKYPVTGWPANAQGNFVIPLTKENAGIYTLIFQTEDKAGNKTSVRYEFTIKNPPTIIRPILPQELLGNTNFAIPVPGLFNDWEGSGFKIYCTVTDPEAFSIEIELTGEQKNVVLTKPGEYKFSYYAKNSAGIMSYREDFTIMSLRGEPVFTEESRAALYARIASLSSEGIAQNTYYEFPVLVPQDAFGIGIAYEMVMFVQCVSIEGAQQIRYDVTTTIVGGEQVSYFNVAFRDEAIYKLSFVCYDIYTGNPVKDSLGNDIALYDTIRTRGNGEISFRYAGEIFVGFPEYDARYSLELNRDGVLNFTKYVLPSAPSGSAKVSCQIELLLITAQGRINGVDTYPGVMIYVFGPGSSINDNGLSFMEALEVKAGGVKPAFRAYETGWYTIIYEAKDANGNLLRMQYKLMVVDETPPVFADVESLENTLRDTTRKAEVSSVVTLPIPLVSDNYDNLSSLVITAQVTCPNGTTIMLSIEEGFYFTPSYSGTHIVTYTVTDLSGNTYSYEMAPFEVVPEVPSETPILGIAIGGLAGLIVMAGAVYFVVYKNVFKVKKLIPTNQ